MVTVYDAARRFRDQLAAQNTATARRMLGHYRRAYAAVSRDLAEVTAMIEARRRDGEQVSADWLRRQDRYRRLQELTAAELDRFARAGATTITDEQRAAARRALAAQRALVAAQTGQAALRTEWVALNTAAVEQLAGQTSAGPLLQLLQSISAVGAVEARDALITGIATGQNPRSTAFLVRGALDTTADRALTIARTETLRAYREASRQQMTLNRHIITGWVWLSAMDARTCAYCWAEQGTSHPPDEIMATHPNCRCTMVPDTGSAVSAGSLIPYGDTSFAVQPASLQQQVLGREAFALYDQGELALTDLVEQSRHPVWGPVGRVKSLSQLEREGRLGRRAGV